MEEARDRVADSLSNTENASLRQSDDNQYKIKPIIGNPICVLFDVPSRV